ncbi:zinc carboxypeptidase-like isoform X2 [Linepithema humile]|uniref:zinc carboxypeptidase-like isoform X2 n=1 Tax=Linepithema humile TaxID=83485 RepID=UPI0006236E95|nr:PREDICTED: zinc carboxypeptidase-like isoform X2 [Linepithema humile]
MWRIIVLCTIINLTVAARSTYENYKVFKIIPLRLNQFNLLRNMKGHGYLFWEEPTTIRRPVKLMVAPHQLPEFYRLLYKEEYLSYELLIDNVQELIDRTTQSIDSGNATYNLNIFPFTKYPTLKDIYNYLYYISLNYIDNVKIIVIGNTYEGNKILGVEISFNNKRKNPGIFLEGGIHGNEWISPATVIYILHQLLTSTDPNVRAMAESHDWYIVPLVNPDGYKYSHTTDRLWRKSRGQYDKFCLGADLNRNWDYMWGYSDRSDMCSNKYAGLTPFSELETRVLKKYIDRVSNKFDTYISFHGSSQLLLFPYGYTTAHINNYNEMYTIGQIAIAALKRRYGTEYLIGNTAERTHIASGSTTDYIRGTYRKPYVYSYGLRGKDNYDFLLPPDQIIPTGQETLDSIMSMLREIKRRKYLKQQATKW